VSGAIAGLAGVSEVAGIQNRLTSGLSPGYGYTGIVVATLGTLTMPGVALAALFLGDLTVGASTAARALSIPSQLGAVVQGVLLLTTVALLALRRYRLRPTAPDEGGGSETPFDVGVADVGASDIAAEGQPG
jgi:general nucleoside transport system permease protein